MYAVLLSLAVSIMLRLAANSGRQLLLLLVLFRFVQGRFVSMYMLVIPL